MPTHTFILNGQRVTVEAENDERLLWVLRDLLGVTGPKYGCGLGACRACTSHVNGRAVSLCSIPVSELEADDHVTTIEGLAATVGTELHPVQQAWIDHDVAQCGFCQPGQIMAAVGLIDSVNAQGRLIDDDDLDTIHNVCRCGTYPRIRQAILAAQQAVLAQGIPSAADAVTALDVADAAGSHASSDATAPVSSGPASADGTASGEVVPAASGSAVPADLPATGSSLPVGLGAAAAAAAVVIRTATNTATSQD